MGSRGNLGGGQRGPDTGGTAVTRGLRLCNAIYWLALVVWISVLISAFVARCGATAILPDMGLTLDDYLTYDVQEHWRIAAGKLMEPIFTFVDLVQFVAVLLVLVAVLLQSTLFRVSLRSSGSRLRLLCLALASVLFAVRAVVIMPSQNRSMRAYWDAAKAAHMNAATDYRESFQATQSVALWMMGATVALLLAAVAIAPPAPATGELEQKPRYEPPALLKDARRK